MNLNIVLATNEKYLKPTATLIMSIDKNSKKNSSIKIHILHSTITQKKQEIIKDMVKNTENISEINFIDMKQFISDNFFDKFIDTTCLKHINQETYYRLFISEIFPQYDKILYLDVDTIVCEDLTSLYNTNIDNLYVGAVSVYKSFFKNIFILKNKKTIMKDYLKSKLNILNNSYFNAGVLLLNLAEMRKDNFQEKALSFLFKKYPLVYMDQDILNSVCKDKVKFLDRRYNVYYRHFLHNKPTTILHFAGEQKPWNFYKLNEGFELYWKYFKLTPFYNEREEKLYLKLRDVPPKEEKNIKIILGRKKYRIKIFHHTFSINPSFYRRSKQKLLSLVCTKK